VPRWTWPSRWSSLPPVADGEQAPLDSRDRDAGCSRECSTRQVQVSRTVVFDAPCRGRLFFEALIADDLHPAPGGFSFLVAEMAWTGQPGGRACSLPMAVVISPAQGQCWSRRRRRPPRTSRPAADSRRGRSRLGSQRRAVPVRASSCVQAVRSQARAAISHHSWFLAKSLKGRFRRPVSLAQRIRSSHRARHRCLGSRSGSWPLRASVAKAVSRRLRLGG
jgi:hypothetical protein